MNVIIAGGSGLVGTLLLNELLADSRVQSVVSISRRSLVSHLKGPKKGQLREVIVSNLSELEARAAELKGDHYFCCLGTTIKDAESQEAFRAVDFTAVIDLAQIAARNRAQSFAVISATGAAPNSKIFYNRVKGEMEVALKKLQLRRLIILRPSLLIGHRKKVRSLERILVGLARVIGPALPSPLRKRAMTEAQTVANRLIQLSLDDGSGAAVQVVEAKEL